VISKFFYADDITDPTDSWEDDLGAGPKEHSFFITFLFHGINLSALVSYLGAKYFNVRVPLHVGLSIGLAVFTVGYLGFFRNKASKILTRDVKLRKIILLALIALAYAAISVTSC